MKLIGFDNQDREHPIGAVPAGRRFSREEGREVFREMVRAETRNGPLSARRRKRLIQYAAALQLTPLEASRIVTDVCRDNGQLDGWIPEDVRRVVETVSTPQRWPVWLTCAGALLAAFIIDRLIRQLVW